MSHDIREALKPWNNRRIKVRGTLDGFGDWTHNRRKSLRACIVDPEVDGKVIGHHVWLTNCRAWEHLRERVGDTVIFHALVTQYVDRQSKTNYCLTNADMPEFLAEPPSLAIPDEYVREERLNDLVLAVGNGKPAVAVPAVVAPTVTTDPVVLMKLTKKFIKACGCPLRAKEAAKFLVDNPGLDLSALVVWIDAMSEE